MTTAPSRTALLAAFTSALLAFSSLSPTRAAPQAEPAEAPPRSPLEEKIAPAAGSQDVELDLGAPAAAPGEVAVEVEGLRASLAARRAAVDELQGRLEFANQRLAALATEFDELQARLDVAGLGLSGEFAALLRQRLERLRILHLDEEIAHAIQAQLEAARVAQFQLEELIATLPAEDANTGLAKTRRRLAQQLNAAVSKHVELLREFFVTIDKLRQQIVAYQGLLEERLFWLPSAPALSLATLPQLAGALAWLVAPAHWVAIAAALDRAAAAYWAGLLALAAALVALLAMRGRVTQRLAATAADVGNVGRDRFGLTLAALGYTVILALPGVVVLLAAALLAAPAGGFGAALSAGLVDAALAWGLLAFLFHVSRAGGLAECHFKWRDPMRRAVRRGLAPLLAVLAVAATLTELTESAAGEAYRDSLGRLVFVVASLALAAFAHHVLATRIANAASTRARRGLFLAYAGAVGAPLALTGLALYGYHYTAVRLESTLFVTACWLTAVALVFYLSVRGLAIRERRLILARLRAQRATERAVRDYQERAEPAAEGVPDTLTLPETDLQTIGTQSYALLRLLIAVLAVAGVLLLWSDVFPALTVLDRMVLWSMAPVTEGGQPLAVSVQDLLLALAIAAGTVFAARNLAGMLEVAVLSRLRLVPGTGYAITTMTTYVIVIAGALVSLALLGAQWSKLQWLIAALGVGLGFGLQEIVANFVSGIILLFERPIRVGDTVTVGPNTGTVSRIRIRATTLTDWDRKEQIIPNKTFVTQSITNWTLSDSITRVIIGVRVAYGSDIDTVHRILTDIAEGNARVADDPPPAVFCVDFGESSIDFEIRVFVASMLDFLPIAHEIRADIVRALNAAGIAIPYPQRDIHIRSGNAGDVGEAG